MALSKGQPEQAVAIFEEGLKKRPRSKKLLVGLIRSKLRLNQCEESLQLLMPVRHTRVANRQVLEGLAACFCRFGDYQEAVYWAEERAYLAPPKADAFANLASYRLGAGDRAGARAAMARAEALDPLSESLLQTRLQVAIGKGQVEQADLLFQELDRIQPVRSQMNWFLRTRLALDLGDYNEAVEASEACLVLGFQFSPIRALRGEIFRRLGLIEEAEKSLTTVYASAPGVVGLKAMEVRLLADQGLFSEAHELLRELQGTSPVRPDVVASAWYLAQVEGDVEEAARRKAMYEVVQFNPYRSLERLIPFEED